MGKLSVLNVGLEEEEEEEERAEKLIMVAKNAVAANQSVFFNYF